MTSVYPNIAPPFVLIRVMLLVYTNASCLYKRVEQRDIRLTKIIIFDDTLQCKITQKLAVILFLTFQLILYSIPSNWFGHFIWYLLHIISLIPRLSHRLEYFSFRTISWSWNSSPNYFMARALRVRFHHNTHESYVCRAKCRVCGTVKSELGQWIRINIGRARLKRNLDLISVFHCHCPRAQLLVRIKASVVRKAKNRLPSKLWITKIIPNFACKFSIKVHIFVLSMSDIKQLTNGIVWNGKSITSML